MQSRISHLPMAFFFLLLVATIPAPSLGQTVVISHQKITASTGGFTGHLDDEDAFGNSCATLGDLDGNGVLDIAVGTPKDDDGGENHGAVWVLFLNPDGTAGAHQKISDTAGNFSGDLDYKDNFGYVGAIGDVDGDGSPDLAVGSILDDDGGTDRGAVWILFLNSNGTVKGHQKISDTEGGFTGVLDDADRFGQSIAGLNDLDGDGVVDIAVGARWDDDGATDAGAMWILFLNSDGTVKSHQKISPLEGGFSGVLNSGDSFGIGSASLGDLDGDGIVDLGVGAYADDDGGTNRGAAWILFLNSNGTVKDHQKISSLAGNFTGDLGNSDYFGTSIRNLGDLDGDGVGDIAVGAFNDPDGQAGTGALWLLFLYADGTVKAHQKLSAEEGGLQGVIDGTTYFGISSTPLGDLDGNGTTDIAVGAHYDDGGGYKRGAMWILLLEVEGGGGVGPAQLVLGNTRGLPQNEEFPVHLSLTNAFPARGVQLTLLDTPDLLRVREVIPSGRAAGLRASFSDEDEATIVVYGLEGEVINPGTGVILILLVDIPGPAALGTVIDLEGVDAFVSDNNGNTDTVTVSPGSVAVGRMSGDITGDNRVDVGDVVRLVEIIVGEDAPPTPEELVEADCNEDDGINVGDITCLVDRVLATPVIPAAAPGQAMNPLTIVNDVPVRGFQFTTGGTVKATGDLVPFQLQTATRTTGTTVVAYDPAGGGWATGTRTPLLTDAPAERVASSFRAYGSRGTPLKVTASGSEIRIGPTTIPPTLRMLASRPNPFLGSTSIHFTTDRSGKARVVVYDVQGRRVSELPERLVDAGETIWSWSAVDQTGRPLATGIYLATVEFEGQRASIRITHLGR